MAISSSTRLLGAITPVSVDAIGYPIQVARGNITGVEHISKFGKNLDVDTGTTPEDMWTGAANPYVPPVAARIHLITGDGNDTSAGTGARTVKIYGLDSNWDKISETVTMNGATGVITTSSFLRIYRAHVVTAGSLETNSGLISAINLTDASVSAQIEAGDGQTFMAIMPIPANKRGYLYSYYITIGRSSPTAVRANAGVHIKEGADASDAAWRKRHQISLALDGTSHIQHSWEFPIYVPEKSEIKLSIEEVSASNSTFTGGFALLLVDD